MPGSLEEEENFKDPGALGVRGGILESRRMVTGVLAGMTLTTNLTLQVQGGSLTFQVCRCAMGWREKRYSLKTGFLPSGVWGENVVMCGFIA